MLYFVEARLRRGKSLRGKMQEKSEKLRAKVRGDRK